MTKTADYPRDLYGYGPNPPDPQWPGGARVALNLVINYEEGGENSILHGDEASEAFLSEVVGAQPWPQPSNRPGSAASCCDRLERRRACSKEKSSSIACHWADF